MSEHNVVGRRVRKVDGVKLVTGKTAFTDDIELPGLLIGKILGSPHPHARIRRIDTRRAKALPGVHAVLTYQDVPRVPHTTAGQAWPEPSPYDTYMLDSKVRFVGDRVAAVAAETRAIAEEALRRIEVDYEVLPPVLDMEHAMDPGVAVIHDEPDSTHILDPKRNLAGDIHKELGNVAEGFKQADLILEREYRTPRQQHAMIEPHIVISWLDADDRLIIRTSTQIPFHVRRQVAMILQIPVSRIRVIKPRIGGGFGGKQEMVIEDICAALALATRRPVKIEYTRAEEFFYDTFGPAAVVKVASGIDGAGRITFWDYQVYAAGGRGANVLYDVANRRVRVYGGRGREGYHPFGTGPWRAPGASSNKFGYEQQIDAMARAAGMDPLEFRLRNTKDPRMLRVLRAVAQAAHWTSRSAIRKDGRGRGLAAGDDAGTYVAHVADVVVDRATGTVKVERVICAQDMGIVVNPDGAKMQTEGAITMALGYCFAEEVQFQGGKILTNNFDTYNFARMSWVPEIEVVLVPNDAEGTQGGGEPGIINMGAVIANAIYDATGARMTRMPMTPERVLAEIRKV